MRLFKVETVGFKSFKDKVLIDVPDGVIGIVGPNGCGKSNIVDAVKWALGEQNPRHLRAKGMEDIVFAGTNEFAAVGMAEVSLFFEQGGEPFPEPYSNLAELVITRRLYRSGDSEYLINRSTCRLKDVQDITLDTGLGQRFYGLIEQGMVESFMNYKPDEKRHVFEEVAGTAKYRMRKRATVQKLDSAKLNLDRVEDILAEVQNRYQELEKEAARAIEYKRIFDGLKRIELYRSAVVYKSLKSSIDEKQTVLDELQKTLAEKELQSGTGESELEVKRNELFFLEKEFDELKKRLYSLEQNIVGAEREYNAVTGGKAQRQEKLGELKQRKDGLAAEKSRIEQDLTALAADIAGFEKRLDDGDGRLRDEAAAEETLNVRIRECTAALGTLQADIIADRNQQAYLQSQSVYEEKMYGDTLERIDAIKGESADLTDETVRFKEEMDDRVRSLSEREGERAGLEATIERLTGQLALGRKEAAELRKRQQDGALQRERLVGTYNSSKKFIEERRGFSSGVQHILKNFPREEVLGSILDHVDVRGEMLTAFENFLKDRQELVFVSTGDVAKKAIRYLKDNNLGSCFLMPLDATGEPAGGADDEFLGSLAINEAVRGAVMRIFSRVRLAGSIDEAIARAAAEKGRHWYITADGDVVDDLGIIYGGSKGSHNPVIVEKTRLKELETEIAAADRELTGLQDAVGRRDDDMRQLEEQIKSRGDELSHISIDISTEKAEIRHMEEELKRRTAKADNLALELRNLELNLGSYQKKKEELVRTAESLTARIAAREQEIVAKNAELDTLRQQLDTKREELTALRVYLAEERRNYHHRKENRNALVAEIAKLDDAYGLLSREEESLLRIDGEAEKRIDHWQAEMARLGSEKSGVAEKVAADETRIGGLRNEIREREKALNTLRTELEKGRKTSLALGEALNGMNMKEQLLVERIREKYFVELARHFEEYLSDPVPDDECADERIEEKWKLLREMGEVNLLAIDEFEEVRNRFEFLQKQKTDIEESIDSLNKAIDRINKISVELFLNSVKNIGENFDKLFRRLFGGGRARIVLVQEDNPLESGVDIAVELPNKKVQSIDLLSGGEKALVALSLIFAFYMQKPSPFCLLDEVDAPLDDANVMKFRDLLKEMSRLSQFMIVTHNKIVMETANVLYGVTMETPGVSKLVSVRTTKAGA